MYCVTSGHYLSLFGLNSKYLGEKNSLILGNQKSWFRIISSGFKFTETHLNTKFIHKIEFGWMSLRKLHTANGESVVLDTYSVV